MALKSVETDWDELRKLQFRAFKNEHSVKRAAMCNCFGCGARFAPDAVGWHKEFGGGLTALCPECGADTVIPE